VRLKTTFQSCRHHGGQVQAQHRMQLPLAWRWFLCACCRNPLAGQTCVCCSSLRPL
jgi:hypothetical protein